jgi:hypothetical protein
VPLRPKWTGSYVHNQAHAALRPSTIGDKELSELTFRLQEGESLTMFTDGIVETRNGKGELYGFERVAAIIAFRRCP